MIKLHISKNCVLHVFVAKVASFLVRLGQLVFDFADLVLTVPIINRVIFVVQFRNHFIEEVSPWKVIQINASVGQVLVVLQSVPVHDIGEILERVRQFSLFLLGIFSPADRSLEYLFIFIHLIVKERHDIRCFRLG